MTRIVKKAMGETTIWSIIVSDLVAIISCSIGVIACGLGIWRISSLERQAHDPNPYAKPMITAMGVIAILLIVGAILIGTTP